MLITVGQRSQRVGAAFTEAAGVVLAHPGGHRRYPLVQDGGIGAEQLAPHRRDAGVFVAVAADGEVAGAGGGTAGDDSGGVMPLDQRVDSIGELVLGQRPPRLGARRDGGIDSGPHRVVIDQASVPGDRGDHPRTHPPLTVQSSDPGKVVAQRLGDADLAERTAVPDVHRRGDFGGRVVPEIARPPRLRAVAIAHTQAGQLGDRRQPIRPRDSLSPGGLLDRGHQRSCVH